MHLITFLVVVVLIYIYIYFEPVNHSRKKMERHKTKRENRKKNLERFIIYCYLRAQENKKLYLFIYLIKIQLLYKYK